MRARECAADRFFVSKGLIAHRGRDLHRLDARVRCDAADHCARGGELDWVRRSNGDEPHCGERGRVGERRHERGLRH
jgi:hypothetical protein